MPPEPVAELVDSVPAPVETPSAPAPEAPVAPEAIKPEAPAPDAKPEVKPDAEQQLFELPDGRKVDAQTLQKEWKENFLPDYTRKSQDLAKIRNAAQGDDPKIIKNEPEWKKPDYVPKTYAEIVEFAKAEALRELDGRSEAAKAHETAIAAQVEGQIAELKKADPSLNENVLFEHAVKYGFHDLKAAHSNMKDMRQAIVDTEQRTLKNLKTREADPVSIGAPGNPVVDDSYDPSKNSGFASAVEYFRSLTKK